MNPTPTSGWLDGREHVLPVRVYYEDTDFTGVVYHANYLRFFERGRSDSLRLAGVSHQFLLGLPEPCALTVTHMSIDFRHAAKIDDALEVRSLFEGFKGVRMHLTQRLLRGGELLAEASVQVACITLEGRPRRPPPDLVNSLNPLLPPAAP